MKSKIYLMIASFVLLGSVLSCTEDDLDPTLAQSKAVETSITELADLTGILNGAFNRMTSAFYYGRDFIIINEIRSDNAFSSAVSNRFPSVSKMELLPTDAYARDTWTQIYAVIASSNILIGQDLTKINGDETKKKHVVGQAYALRALAHFDLLKLYGQQHVTGGNDLGIPYVFKYKGEDLYPKRNTVAEVKKFINDDLDKALTLLSATLDTRKDFVTIQAVNALKSRVAIYFKDWAVAKTACEAVINSNKFSIAASTGYAATWIAKQPSNSIFELAYSATDHQGINGLYQIYNNTAYGDIEALQNLKDVFDSGDVRATTAMIGLDAKGKLRNLGKYRSPTFADNIFLIRYEEVILNYAEALFRINAADANALTRLNSITSNRGAVAYTVVNEANILQERRRELCFEGFRFDDLARTGRNIPLVDAVRQTHGGPAYGSYNYAFPIPTNEINANSNMVQNKGY
ncbi:MAG: RagB/SusD family nutrient uptake outer membrane protein [Flavobacteriaceae bacterium]|nr:RagB/SusD family nutrient uptake outer membrane protein [Flavobacteriaceae bacterium]